MRLAHLADLHLGFRQFQRVTRAGVNLREADVARAFLAAVDAVIALAPELVVVAGDLFHASRPPNNAIVFAHKQFVRLREALPETVIVIVAGNHDAPRTADTGNILALFEALGIHVATGTAMRIDAPALELSVLAVPELAGVQPEIAPNPERRYNVLVVHGEVEYAEPSQVAGWDYIALGHYHVHRTVAPVACYAGSLDYTSSNPWGELAEERASSLAGKGFVLADLDARTVTHHALPVVRGFADLGLINGANKTAEELDALIREAVESCAGGIDEKVVRLALVDVTRPTARALDQKALRAYRSRALNFQLTFQKPVEIAAGTKERPVRRRLSLEELVREALAKRAVPGDINRTDITNLALSYVNQAGEQLDAKAADDALVGAGAETDT